MNGESRRGPTFTVGDSPDGSDDYRSPVSLSVKKRGSQGESLTNGGVKDVPSLLLFTCHTSPFSFRGFKIVRVGLSLEVTEFLCTRRVMGQETKTVRFT